MMTFFLMLLSAGDRWEFHQEQDQNPCPLLSNKLVIESPNQTARF